MYCVSCGAEVTSLEAAFCQSCGKSLKEKKEEQLLPNTPKKFPFTLVFWLLAFCTFGAWVGYLLLLLTGNKALGMRIVAAILWTGGTVAYVSKKRYGKGWRGFGQGALVSVVIIIVSSYAVGYLAMQDPSAQISNNQTLTK